MLDHPERVVQLTALALILFNSYRYLKAKRIEQLLEPDSPLTAHSIGFPTNKWTLPMATNYFNN